MENFYLHEFINSVGGDLLLGDPHSLIKGISTDTRNLLPQDYFLALKGKNYDGHDFIAQAIKKGCAGIILSRKDVDYGNPFTILPNIVKVDDTLKALGDSAAYYRRKWNIPVIGVTGSNGKTTTKEMIASILSKIGPTLKNIGNFNNLVGVPLTVFNLSSVYRYAVIELGTSIPGEISRLSHIIKPIGGVITNIGLTHLENFHNKEGVLQEKRSLIDNLDKNGWIILNIDDPLLKDIIPTITQEVITISTEKNADVFARNIRIWPEMPEFELVIEGKSIDIKLPLYGKFNISNALCAASVAWRLGADLKLIKEGIESFSQPNMRMEIKNLFSGITIINDAYNANPTSMRESILSIIQSFPDRSKILVLADMLELGENANIEHTKLGEFLAAQPVSKILLYGNLMRNALDVLDGMPVKHFEEKEDLLLELKQNTFPGTVIFFKGSRGMKLEEIIEQLLSIEDFPIYH